MVVNSEYQLKTLSRAHLLMLNFDAPYNVFATPSSRKKTGSKREKGVGAGHKTLY